MRLNSHCISSVHCPLLTFSHLNLSPPTYHQRSWIYVDRLTYNTCHEPSVTDASNRKKQLYYKWSATICSFCHIWGLSPNGHMLLVAGWRRNISWLAPMVLTGMYWSWNRPWYSVMTMSTILLRFWTKFSQKLVTQRLVKIHTCDAMILTILDTA